MEEVKKEWRAQIEAFMRAAGRKPTHLDSHHHSSYFSPGLFQACWNWQRNTIAQSAFHLREISQGIGRNEQTSSGPDQKFNPSRPDRFVVDFYDERATHEELMNVINSLPDGTTEIMCHPGYTDDAFAKKSVYNDQRDRELKILTDPSIKEAIQANGIQLITFAEL